MKINWGTSIVIAFVLFISFIMYFVFKVQSESKYESELVVEEYYKKDAKFGDEMVKIQNAHDLIEKPSIKTLNGTVTIEFPSSFNPKKITGKVSLYRPSNKKLDFEVPISLSNSALLIPKKSLVGGRWDITLDWQYEGEFYTSTEELYIK